MSNEVLIVKGAKVHNLKNIDCEISHNSLTVLTGVSGSGKSSLAFDTIYAEGQRRYIESLSAYARQFLERMEKPAVDEVMGIAPAIAIKQKNTVRNPRSTVGTVTEIYDYLRLLYARIGRTYCWQCHREVKKDILEDVVQFLLSFPEHTRIYVLFPFSSYRKMLELKETSAREKRKKKPANKEQEAVKAALSDLRKQGFNRLYQNKQIYELSTPESLLNLDFTAEIFVLVDRVAIQPDIRQRLIGSPKAIPWWKLSHSRRAGLLLKERPLFLGFLCIKGMPSSSSQGIDLVSVKSSRAGNATLLMRYQNLVSSPSIIHLAPVPAARALEIQ